MIGYLRVSAEEQAHSGLGPAAQCECIQRSADAHCWDVTSYVDEGLSAKSLDRPQLQAALARLHVIPKRRDVAGIVVATLDRLCSTVGPSLCLASPSLSGKFALWMSKLKRMRS
jgi:DNA invertase Pin-like site-specific DNA recombinase